MIYIPASQFRELRPARLPPRPLEVPKARFAIPATAANRLSTLDVSKREDHQGNRGNAGGTHGGTR